ncbi:hypothetical protein STSP2_00947 [Anaerohalosphaera lusitana]|uniref:Uncharacterized protein n=1 Tax=Anaerohalosphaera lusitana TaxID=1936003 RepID=A0A1U9NJ88_9BACT|nr:hypothetical protein STSP2_00947 [Anaerohalosphaera lusitana]
MNLFLYLQGGAVEDLSCQIRVYEAVSGFKGRGFRVVRRVLNGCFGVIEAVFQVLRRGVESAAWLVWYICKS